MWSGVRRGTWTSWCENNGLVSYFDDALYVSSWAFYGSGFRTRPGTLVVTPSRIIHHSYSVAETVYAAFEPSVRVVLEPVEVTRAARIRLSVWWWALNLFPSGAARLTTGDGHHHDLILHQRAAAFRESLATLGISWQRLPESRRMPG